MRVRYPKWHTRATPYPFWRCHHHKYFRITPSSLDLHSLLPSQHPQPRPRLRAPTARPRLRAPTARPRLRVPTARPRLCTPTARHRPCALSCTTLAVCLQPRAVGQCPQPHAPGLVLSVARPHPCGLSRALSPRPRAPLAARPRRTLSLGPAPVGLVWRITGAVTPCHTLISTNRQRRTSLKASTTMVCAFFHGFL